MILQLFVKVLAPKTGSSRNPLQSSIKAYMKHHRVAQFSLFAALAAGATGLNATAGVFSDNFDTDTSSQWRANASGAVAGSDRALFSYDYSTLGIPSAPHSVGGTTRGLILQANRTGAVQSGISVSPTGQHFDGDYTLRFDLWQNFNGPAPTGGSGSTQVSGAGIMTAGTTPQWAGATYDSLFFGTTGDGNSSSDYRVYNKANTAAAALGFYAAGTTTTPNVLQNSHPYYANFGGVSAPAAQTALFPQQTGVTAAGAQAFSWHDVEIQKKGGLVTWTIDGKLIASVDSSGTTYGGDNFLLTHFDINAGISTDPNADSLLFGLYDNIRVTPVPEPASVGLAFGALALAGGAIRRRMVNSKA